MGKDNHQHQHSCHCHTHGHDHCHEHNHGHGHHQEHGHSHEHHHGGMKGRIALIAATAVLLAMAVVVEHTCNLATWQLLIVYLVPYLLVGHDTLREAVEGVMGGSVFNEHLLMSVATIGALCIGFMPGAETEFPEAVFVMLFFQVGELFEGYAEGQSRRSISHLMDIRPDVANVERGGRVEAVSPDDVAVGETIVVRPGEKVPIDGRVVEGASSMGTIALTGESAPRDVAVGDTVVSGCVNLSGVIRVVTTKAFGESTVAKIIQLVESADNEKSRSESFIAHFARCYTPAVVLSAVVLAVVPPLQPGVSFAATFPTWLHRALIFLVVSCPCALVISVPLTFFAGLGGASRRGILIKGSGYMDALANIGTMVFDKTGTLTRGEFAVEAVHPDDFDERELLHLAAHVERYSTHPIGEALRAAFPDEGSDGCRVGKVVETAGHGVCAYVAGREVIVGNAKMMEARGVRWRDCHRAGTIIHVAVDGRYAGHIVVCDRIKDDSQEAIAQLRRLGVAKTVMLTGDRDEVGRDVAARLAIDECHTELLPVDKVVHVKRLLMGMPDGKRLAFVGDGINDAPVLRLADVGIAMGALGSDAAIEAADVVLMDDQPSKIATAIAIARRTLAIARENVWFAIGVKLAVLALATAGLGTMWMAVFADVGVTVVAVLNAMRALRS